MKSPDMHRRAATLAGAIRSRTIVLWHEGGAEDFRARGEDQDLTADALAAYAAQDAAAPAEVREVVFNAIHDRVNEPKFCSERDLVNAIFAALAASGYVIALAPTRPDDRQPFAPGAPVTVQHGTSAERPDTVVECMRATDGDGWSVRLASGIWVSAECCTARDALRAPFQVRVRPWMLACFGEEIAADREERNHRFLEEALELVQSCDCTLHEAHQLVDYVFGRPVGEPRQEVGGVMVTLAALCLANGLDMHEAGEAELARIWTKVDAIRAKQAAKPKHSPLPMHVDSDPARPTVGETWETGGVMVKAVPVEPTEAMEEDADDAFHAAWKASNEIWERGEAYRESVGLPRRLKHGSECHASVTFVKPIWSAMLAAVAKEATP